MIANSSLKNFLSQYDVPRPVDWEKVFCSPVPLDLEIGSGNGEFIHQLARDKAKRNYVGIDQHWERICKTLNKLTASDLANVRIMMMDARVALERLFKPRSVGKIYCLFPCPWPKKKHTKHRLFSNDFLRLVNSRLADRGTLQIVTDHKAFRNWVLEQADSSGFTVRTKTVRPRFGTKFERKWVEGGQNRFFEILFTKSKHINVPVRKDAAVNPCYVKKFSPKTFKFTDLKGKTSIIHKGMVWDEKQKVAMVHLVIAEENMTQQFWASVKRTPKGWKVVPAEGMKYLPTVGVAAALKRIAEACR